jgi:uncharacterized protein (TIGR02186 family)
VTARFVLILSLAAGASLTGPARAADDGLVSHLEADHVDVTSEYTGEDLLFFGSLARGGELIIKVVSPEQVVALDRKIKVGPAWLDGERLLIQGMPGLLYLLSSRPIDELLSDSEQARYGLRLSDALNHAQASAADAGGADWGEAFLRLKKRSGYYLEQGDAVNLEQGRLFYTRVPLPAASPLGRYELSVYLVRAGRVVAQQTQALDVREVRIEHWADRVAHEQAWLFGAGLMLVCVSLGLLLGVALRHKPVG